MSYVLGEDTLLSQSFSPPGSVNGQPDSMLGVGGIWIINPSKESCNNRSCGDEHFGDCKTPFVSAILTNESNIGAELEGVGVVIQLRKSERNICL